MTTIRIGVVGAGGIGVLTALDFARHPDAEVTAIADLNQERAENLASRVGASFTCTQPAALIARDDIDAVYLAIPNAAHETVACAVLAAGKHLLLDKPFAVNSVAAANIARVAEENDRVLMLGMNQRFERNVQRARLLVDAGSLGEIYHVKAYWRRRRGIPRLGSWFTHKATSGGGALLDIGVHVLDVALYLLGTFEPVAVSGATFTRFGNRGLGEGSWGDSEREFDSFDVDDFATAFIRLADGRVVTLEAAWALHQLNRNEHDVVLYGEEAGLAVYADQLFRDGKEGEYEIIEGATTPPLPFPHCSRVHHFVNVLLGKETPIIAVAEALAVQKILDAIYKSAETGREVLL